MSFACVECDWNGTAHEVSFLSVFDASRRKMRVFPGRTVLEENIIPYGLVAFFSIKQILTAVYLVFTLAFIHVFIYLFEVEKNNQ